MVSSLERGDRRLDVAVCGHGHVAGPVEHVDLVTGARRDVPTDPAVGLVDLDSAPDGSSFAAATTEGTVTLWE